jgi:hypothetical protein
VSASQQGQRGGPRTATTERTEQARAAGQAAEQPQPTAPPVASSVPRPGAPRRVRLTVARVDPWSVMKLAFLLSVAIGIALVVAAALLWTVLEGMGVFADVSRVVGEIIGDPAFDLAAWVGFSKVVSAMTVIAVVDVVLITAISTLGAFLYNISAALVGGLHVTLSDD